MKMDCEHKDFKATVSVGRIEDIGRFVADITIECAYCKLPFRFLGLPMGMNYDGATINVDGTELRAGIAPYGQSPPPVAGVSGYKINLGDSH